MVWFIIGAIVVVGAWVATLIAQRLAIGIVGTVVGLILMFLSSFYTQEVGEALVVKNADGTIAREDTTAGFDMKLPWQDTISFDIKGQQALFKGNGQGTSDGEQVDRPEVTVSTSDKVPSNVDVAVRYSIQPDKVSEIYTTYKTEENLFQRLISQDITSVVKDAAGKFTVDTLIADRTAYSKAIEDALKSRWNAEGIVVESVALQTVRPPQSILDRINASQAAQQQLVQTQADTKVVEEKAKQQVIEAKGKADANRIVNDSLTPGVLKKAEIDALANAKYLIAGNSGGTILQVPAQ
jgi:regulator of protease activity HflC (stomatin/prohibitin superfamily)